LSDMNEMDLRRLIRQTLVELLTSGEIERIRGKGTFDLHSSALELFNVDNPKVRLHGTESGAKNLSIRENAGLIEIYDEEAAAKSDDLDGSCIRDGTIDLTAKGSSSTLYLSRMKTASGSVTVTIPIGGGSATASISKPADLSKIGAILTFRVRREAPIVNDVYDPSFGINASQDAVGITLAAGTGTTLTAEALMLEA